MSVLGRIRDAIRSEDAADYDFECDGCGAGFDLQRQVCPHCGSYSIDSASFLDADGRR
jgi:rRNA maturation endonuclease Nob1